MNDADVAGVARFFQSEAAGSTDYEGSLRLAGVVMDDARRARWAIVARALSANELPAIGRSGARP